MHSIPSDEEPLLPPNPDPAPPEDPGSSGSSEEPLSFQLYRRYRQGDEDALAQLFAIYYPRVRRIIRARLNDRLRRYCDDDDLVQRTFLAALRGLEGFEMQHRGSLYTWFARIVENQIRSVNREGRAEKRDRGREVTNRGGAHGDSTSSPAGNLPGNLPTPSAPLQLREDEELIDLCLRELPENEREVILLRNYQEEPWESIRDALSLPSVDAAQHLRYRAKQHLKEIVHRRREDLPKGFSQT